MDRRQRHDPASAGGCRAPFGAGSDARGQGRKDRAEHRRARCVAAGDEQRHDQLQRPFWRRQPQRFGAGGRGACDLCA